MNDSDSDYCCGHCLLCDVCDDFRFRAGPFPFHSRLLVCSGSEPARSLVCRFLLDHRRCRFLLFGSNDLDCSHRARIVCPNDRWWYSLWRFLRLVARNSCCDALPCAPSIVLAIALLLYFLRVSVCRSLPLIHGETLAACCRHWDRWSPHEWWGSLPVAARSPLERRRCYFWLDFACRLLQSFYFLNKFLASCKETKIYTPQLGRYRFTSVCHALNIEEEEEGRRLSCNAASERIESRVVLRYHR